MSRPYIYSLTGHTIKGQGFYGFDTAGEAFQQVAAWLAIHDVFVLSAGLEFNHQDCTYGCTVYYDPDGTDL